MQQLIEGVHRFQRETFGCSRELEEGLNRGALFLDGWLFKTATRELLAEDPATGQIEPLKDFREGRHA